MSLRFGFMCYKFDSSAESGENPGLNARRGLGSSLGPATDWLSITSSKLSPLNFDFSGSS